MLRIPKKLFQQIYSQLKAATTILVGQNFIIWRVFNITETFFSFKSLSVYNKHMDAITNLRFLYIFQYQS